jgi:methionyl-tRNA synthetase
MNHPIPKKIFIGVSWPYANGDIHLGHLAGQNVACDVFARFHRLKGHDVLMVSGSDSHGAPVVFKAEEMGITPAKLAQQCHESIVKTFDKLGFVYENYTKTTTENHKIVVQNIFTVLKDFGFLEIQASEQYYDSKVKRFLPDRYVRGTCPNCKATNARGDECPECGAYLNPTDLIDPFSTLSDAKPKLKKTKHFYMNLQMLEGDISKWVKKNSKRWRKWVREFTKGWIKQGLEPRAVTRDLNFGIPVPVKGWENKVIYVWIEAVVGYLSAAVEWADNQKNPSLWEGFWKNPECEHYYFIAGGNVPFHTIMWPAEISAYNKKYENKLEEKYLLPGEISNKPLNLPFDVPANKMLFFKGKKMSKGDGTGITIASLLEKYNPDLIRYFFVRFGPENHDRDYTWKDLIDANNNELVANVGNFINRSLTFLYTKFDGVVPDEELDDEVKEKINSTFDLVSSELEKASFVKAAEYILELGHFANKYFNDKQPWVTIKTERGAAEHTIYNTVQLVNALRILLKPFIPYSTDKLSEILNIEDEYNPTQEVKEKGRVSKYVDQWHFEKIEAGKKINQPSILFEKLDYTEDLLAVDSNK